MALSINQTLALSEVLRPGMKVASMGYPDLIAPQEMLVDLFGTRMNYVDVREDSDAICARHGLNQRPILDALSMFKMLDAELHVYDIVCERGCERLCDLNVEGDLEYAREAYDLVLDVGTSEHIMNIWQALVNMAGSVKKDGYIIHENPHSGWGNHGFYSIHPTLFHDFYSANGFSIEKCLLVARNGETQKPPLTKRFIQQGEIDLNVFCVAKRLSIEAFKTVVQSKYCASQAAPAAGVDRAKEIAHAGAN